MKNLFAVFVYLIFCTQAAFGWESWANGWLGNDDNWFNSANWSAGRVPDYNDLDNYTNAFVAQIAGDAQQAVVPSGQYANCYKLQIGTLASPSPAEITVEPSGHLTSKEYILLGNTADTFGVFNNNGGLITVGTYLTVGGNGIGIFTMNGGILDVVTTLSIPSTSTGTGRFYLNAGLVRVSSAGSGVNIGTKGVLEISSGTLNIDNKIRIWADGGRINLFGGTIYANQIELPYGTITMASGSRIVIDSNAVELLQQYIDAEKIVLANSTDSEFSISYNGSSTTLAAVESGYDLWTAVQMPELDAIAYPDGIENVKVHKAIEGEYQFLHGAAIVEHKGVFYSNWANSPVDENSDAECVRGRRSYDGGFTWGPIEMVAPPIDGSDAHSHGVYFSDGSELWFFAAHFMSPATQTDAYKLDEANDVWVFQAVAASAFHPFDEPQQMSNGKWIIGGDTSVPKVAIFDQNSPESWTIVNIPIQSGTSLLWPETSLWVDGSKITAISRNSKADRALISFSYNCGQSWTTAVETDFPMSAAKPFAGTLSTGQHYLIYNPPSDWPGRITLAVAVSKPCDDKLCKVWKIRHGTSEQPLYEGYGKFPQWSYPYAIEQDGNLYVVYSVGKEDCDMSIIPVESLQLAGDGFSDMNSDCKTDMLDFALFAQHWLEYIN